ncbi:MAG: hypothetical protein R3Y59_08510 [bacterium]
MEDNQELKSKKKSAKTIVASFIVEEELHRRLKVYAASTGQKLKDVVNEAFLNYLEQKE